MDVPGRVVCTQRAGDVFITIQTVNSSGTKNDVGVTTNLAGCQFSHYAIIIDVQRHPKMSNSSHSWCKLL